MNVLEVINMGYLDTIGGTPQHDPRFDNIYEGIPFVCEMCQELEECEFLDRDELCKKAMKLEKKRQKEEDAWADGYYEFLVRHSCSYCNSFSTEYAGNGSFYCNDCKKMFEINKLHMLKKSISVHIFYMMRFFKTIKRAFVRRWSR